MFDAFCVAMGGLVIIFFMLLVVFYVLKSVGITALAANKGLENAWLGWVPVADLYIAGQIVGEMTLFGYRIPNLSLWLPVVMVGSVFLSWIPVLDVLVWIAALIFFIAFSYVLFNMYTSNALLFTLLGVILGLWPIFVFMIRDNQPLHQDIEKNVFPPPQV